MNLIQSYPLTVLLCLLVLVGTRLDAAENWPQFRGPGSRGLPADGAKLPHEWSAEKNIAWKADVPGLGWSSPVVWGGKIFLTTVTRDAGEEKAQMGLYLGKSRGNGKHRYLVLCYDFASGKELWRREVHADEPQSIHLKNSYASATMAADAQRVVALFHDVGLFAFDHDGKSLWDARIKRTKTLNDWGHGGSPTLHDGRVYLVDDNETDSFAAAYDAASGKELWRVKRDQKTAYTTPFVWTESGGAPQLIVPSSQRTVAYDLAGKEVWSYRGGMSSLTICTPFTAHGLLFVGSGYFQDKTRGLFAIKPGAKGDITPDFNSGQGDAFAWFNMRAASYNPTPLVHGDELYVLYDQGMLSCYDARTGAAHYEKTRLVPPGAGINPGFTASPWAHDGKIFCLGENAETFVVKAGKQFELLGRNALDKEPCLATPALVGDSVILRTAARLYRIAGGAKSASAPAASGWEWLRPVAGASREEGGALHLKMLPGNIIGGQTSAANFARHPLPAPLAPGLATEVTVTATPRGGFEQAGLLWQADDDHYVKIIVERLGAQTVVNFASEDAGRFRLWRALDGQTTDELKLIFPGGQAALGRVGDAQNQSLALAPLTTESVQFRLSLTAANKIRGDWRASGDQPWQLLAECPLPAKPPTHAALATMQGAANAERWCEFRDFKIASAVKL